MWKSTIAHKEQFLFKLQCLYASNLKFMFVIPILLMFHHVCCKIISGSKELNRFEKKKKNLFTYPVGIHVVMCLCRIYPGQQETRLKIGCYM